MPENYDDLISEMGQFETVAGNSPQDGQLSKEEFAAKMKAERDRLSELANTTEMALVGDGDSFQRYLNTLARFDRYSAQNTLLIHAQRPDATRLGDYGHWKDAGIPVSKGATSISIFEPGKEYKREDGTTGVSINVKNVFDISQTVARNSGQAKAAPGIRTLLKALMSNTPAPIKLVDSLPEYTGAHYDEQCDVIEVVRGLDGESLFRCLAQEIVYAELDHRVVADSAHSFPPNGEKLDRSVAPHSPKKSATSREPYDGALQCNDKGFSAYAASYALCAKHGIDTKGYDFSEVQGYFAGREGKEIRGELKTIRDTVNDVATRMARTLNPPEKQTKNQEARS